MQEFVLGLGCISALIVLPILIIGITRLRSRNQSLGERVTKLERSVAELREALDAFVRGQIASQATTGQSESIPDPQLLPPPTEMPDIGQLILDRPLPEEPISDTSTRESHPDDLISDSSIGPTAPPTAQPSATKSAEELLGASSGPPVEEGAKEETTPISEGAVPELAMSQASFLKGISQGGSRDEAEPPKPPAERAANPLFEWFGRMHIMVQIGLLILFIGIAFLIKFAADQGWYSIELRLLTAAAFGVALTTVGWRLRYKVPTYAMALMGGGLATAYLTTYGAIEFIAFPATLAFPVFVLLGVIGAVLSILTNQRILAFLAIVGAFLAPLLASSGEGNHIVLFSYYAVVNAGILAIAWFKAWRSLNVVGYFFTMVVGLFWGLENYSPDLFSSIEFFLILFFLMYVGIAALFAARKSQSDDAKVRQDAVDVTLVFGNPLVAFAIQSYLMTDVPNGLAISTFVAGMLYLVIALLAVLRWRIIRPVAESFLFLAGLFIALSIPLTFDLQITSAIWAIMGAAWVWAGATRKRWWRIAWGALIQLGAAGALMVSTNWFTIFEQSSFINSFSLSALLVALSGYASGYLTRRVPAVVAAQSGVGNLEAKDGQPNTQTNQIDWLALFSATMTIWGHLWWFGNGVFQITDFVHERESINYIIPGILSFSALSTFVSQWLGARLHWGGMGLPAILLLPAMMIGALLHGINIRQPLFGGGWYAWPIAFAVHYWALYGWETRDESAKRWTAFHHVGAVWLLVGLVTWAVTAFVQPYLMARSWRALTVIGIPTLSILLLLMQNRLVQGNSSEWQHREGLRVLWPISWPIAQRMNLYLTWGAGPLVLLMLLLTLSTNNSNGDATPLPYMPLLNPIDLVQIGFFGVAFMWLQQTSDRFRRIGYWLFSIAAFFSFNGLLARVVHQYMDVPFVWGQLWADSRLQTLYAVSWSLLALVLMFISHRKGEGWRGLWSGGAIVLALTVAKLFLVDLASSGTIARIISFIGTGVLIIVIAYFAPVPPRATEEIEIEGDEGDGHQEEIAELNLVER